MSPAGLAAQAQGNLVYSICCSVIPTNYSRNQNTVEPPLTVPSPQRPLLYNGHCFWRTDLGTSAQRPRWGHKQVAFVEKFKQESMYALSAQKKWPLLSGCRCGEVAVSGSSTVQSSRGKRRGSNVQIMNASPSIYTVYVTLYYEGLDFELRALLLFYFLRRAREVKDHTFFKELDWKLVELLKVRGHVAR